MTDANDARRGRGARANDGARGRDVARDRDADFAERAARADEAVAESKQSGLDREALRKYRAGEDLTDGGKYGPLGAGHDPEKDPMKGLRGVMAGTLVMQAISVWLGLTVVMRVDDGSLIGPTASAWYIGLLGLAMVLMAGMQGRPWAMKANIALQVLGVLAVITHWSMGFVGVFFAAVWWYILNLRKSLIARMEKGMLTTQHT